MDNHNTKTVDTITHLYALTWTVVMLNPKEVKTWMCNHISYQIINVMTYPHMSWYFAYHEFVFLFSTRDAKRTRNDELQGAYSVLAHRGNGIVKTISSIPVFFLHF